MEQTERHRDDGRGLHAFADEVAVVCPACKSPGLVHATWVPYKWHARFHCSQCALSLDSAEGNWYGPVCLSGRAPCGFCGHKWIAPSRELTRPPAHVPAHLFGACPKCSHRTRVAVSAQALCGHEAIDPHFGLALRLVTTTRFGAMWAYNACHIAAMQAYIAATLRERVGTCNSSMFSRLPVWMKQARHRDEVLRALRHLQRKLAAT